MGQMTDLKNCFVSIKIHENYALGGGDQEDEDKDDEEENKAKEEELETIE